MPMQPDLQMSILPEDQQTAYSIQPVGVLMYALLTNDPMCATLSFSSAVTLQNCTARLERPSAASLNPLRGFKLDVDQAPQAALQVARVGCSPISKSGLLESRRDMLMAQACFRVCLEACRSCCTSGKANTGT